MTGNPAQACRVENYARQDHPVWTRPTREAELFSLTQDFLWIARGHQLTESAIGMNSRWTVSDRRSSASTTASAPYRISSGLQTMARMAFAAALVCAMTQSTGLGSSLRRKAFSPRAQWPSERHSLPTLSLVERLSNRVKHPPPGLADFRPELPCW